MTVLVTGASGHIGANLTRELIKQNRSVRALIHKDKRGVEGLDIDVVHGDILDYPSLSEAVKGCDTVYHLAASISIVGFKSKHLRKINLTGTQNVIKACQRARVRRLIHFNSIYAYSPDPCDQPVDETRPFQDFGSHSYDCSKAEGTQEVLNAVNKGLDAVVITPTAVIGPNDFKFSRMGKVLVKMAQRKFIALVKGGYNWVDVRDVVKGSLQAEKKAAPGSQFILSGHWCSVRRLAEIVDEVKGVKPPRFTAPLWLARFAAPFSEAAALLRKKTPLLSSEALTALKSHRFISRCKAKNELDYHPRPLKETISDTLFWFEERGMLD
jgi:dihydroflavonol-4-reductase